MIGRGLHGLPAAQALTGALRRADRRVGEAARALHISQPARAGRRWPSSAGLVLLVLALLSASITESARGSVLPQTPTLGCNATSNFFFTTMTTQQESPIPGPNGPIVNPTAPSPLPGNGLATALLDPSQTQLRVTLSYQGLVTGAKRFHIHQLVPPTAPNPEPPANATGGIIIPFIEPPNPAVAPDIPNPLLLPPPPIVLALNPLAPSTISALQTIRTPNASYFNVHTLTNPGGEIRGATICATLTPGLTSPGCVPGQVLPFASGQATGSLTCNPLFTYTITPTQVPADAPVGSRPVVIIPVVNAAGQATFDTFNCDQTVSAARTVTCSGTGPAGDAVSLGANVLLAFEGALTFAPTGTLQSIGFAATTVSPGVNPPPTTGQPNTPCAGAVGQTCTVTGGVTGPWTKRASGSFAFTAVGPGGTLPLSFPTVFIPTTIGVENIPCNQLPAAAPFTATCVGNTVGDVLQGATITVRFVQAAGGTADVTGVATGPGAAGAVPIAPVAVPVAAARQPIVIGPLLPPIPPLPPLPPPPPFPPFAPGGMGQLGGIGQMGGMSPMSGTNPATQPTPARATPTPEPASSRTAPANNTAQSTSPATDPMPLGAPAARPAAADVSAPSAPAAATQAPDPSVLMPAAAPAIGDAAVDPSSALPLVPDPVDSVEPLSQEP
jgi:hypothetical protein